MRVFLSAVAIILSCFALSACNTVNGFGQDLQSGGRAISSVAQ